MMAYRGSTRRLRGPPSFTSSLRPSRSLPQVEFSPAVLSTEKRDGECEDDDDDDDDDGNDDGGAGDDDAMYYLLEVIFRGRGRDVVVSTPLKVE